MPRVVVRVLGPTAYKVVTRFNRARKRAPLCAHRQRSSWVLPASPTCLRNGRGNASCSAFHPTDPAFEPCLHQRRSPPPGNAILRGRDKGPERPLEIQSTDCGDKIHARIAASSGLFATNREISVCARLRGGVGRTRTSNQAVIVKRWAKHSATILPTSTTASRKRRSPQYLSGKLSGRCLGETGVL
jgi:hypothetical protein